jgi:hypothetical protein
MTSVFRCLCLPQVYPRYVHACVWPFVTKHVRNRYLNTSPVVSARKLPSHSVNRTTASLTSDATTDPAGTCSLDALSCQLIHPHALQLDEDVRPIAAAVLSSMLPEKQISGPLRSGSKAPRIVCSSSLAAELDESPVRQTSHQAHGSRDEEDILALVSPFEGGEIYIRSAVEQVACAIDADIIRIDLTLAVGFGCQIENSGSYQARF